MERDFEREFRELKQSETPDLWNRIEAALPEKKIAAVPLAENNMLPIERYVPKKRMSWRNWGILVAACFCALILIPAVFLRVADLSGGADSDSAMTESESTGSESGAAQWEDADTAAEADTGMAESLADADVEASESAADAGMSEGVSEAAAAAAETDDVGNKGAGASTASEWEDGQVLEGVMVEITDVDLFGQEVFYEALVIEADGAQMLSAGMEVRIFCNAESVFDFPLEPRERAALKTGARYTVTLRYQEAYGDDDGEEPKEEEERLTFLVIEANREK